MVNRNAKQKSVKLPESILTVSQNCFIQYSVLDVLLIQSTAC